MKLDLFNIEDFIKVNHLQEVTSPIGLTSTKMPNPDGIFSYEIFGYTTEERKNTFAYVDLRGVYMHPQCMRVINRMGALGKIANGEKYAVVVNHKVHPVDKSELDKYPEAETGTSFFYNHWDELKNGWASMAILTKDNEEDADSLSIDKKNRLKLFKYLNKDLVLSPNQIYYTFIFPININ